MKKRTLALLLGLILAVGLCACGSAADPAPAPAPAETTEEDAAATEQEPEGYYFADGVLVSRDVRIEITDWRVIPVGEPGNEYGEKPVIAFWYSVTNLSGKEDITPGAAWIAIFTAYQDTDANQINELDVGMAPDEEFLDSDWETIKEGGTAPSAIAYELDSDTVPVVLKATRGVGGEDLGEQEFDITQSAMNKTGDPKEAAADAPEDAAAQEPAEPTMGQKNAVQKAQAYLRLSGFSKKGIEEQLKYDGFTEAEAVYGAENCGADWNEQAVTKAKAYTKLMSFSKQGLIDQLKYDGFTEEEAEYGATGAGY